MTSLIIVIFLIFSLSTALEISSKLDFDSDEKCSESSTINSDPAIIVIKNEPDVPKETRVSRPSGSRSISGSNYNFRNAGNTRRTWNNYNPASSQSKTIKNIYIIVNGKGIISSIPNSVNCKDNICEETIVSTSTDNVENDIASVSVKIQTKPVSIDIVDVPVIDGIRASGYEYVHDAPTFIPDNLEPVLPHPHFIDNNIPQAQVPRRNPPRPQSASFHPRNFVPRTGEPTFWNPWIPVSRTVDDKIEPPLSKTQHAVQ